ncbi:unnamed protein product (macronuclear) [Paramecium tetraurelia]|uniref:EF-hand domain-containing protein n=1 Tax=Paramecium tetraurelia TaxID=5888 RepID=A0BJ07_PARTE|nr:uncharacterized protein GSPATT00004897001 [Paramecium tetraurelia]CAK58524.1 unnamed protein product [Paramecium tetraurelia]|eukprot:XP_001425922.1 hypothetical protein (macronuclear) [Paramecium tetraurelia strain d4-2]
MNPLNDHQQTSPRSPLHASNVNSWFKSRHCNKVKKSYLLFPEQIKQEQEIQKIFQNFDRDNSNNLDITEMYDMFQKYGFKVTEQQLQHFFKVVDKDKDNALNWNEFKNSVFDEQASKLFYNIIKQIREQDQNESQSNHGYIPFQFNEMISYLNYLISRDELQKSIQEAQQTTFEKFQKYLTLLELNQIQMQNFNNQTQTNINSQEEQNFTKKEIDFTKTYQNKYKSSKSSYLNGKDLPQLQKLKSEKKKQTNTLLQLNKSIESSKINLQNSISFQPTFKIDKFSTQLNSDFKSLHNMKSLQLKLNQSPSNQKNFIHKPYLNLNLNKINQNYREQLFSQQQMNDKNKYGNNPDRLPISIIQELQKFKLLSGQFKKRSQSIEKNSPECETRCNNLKSEYSIFRTSTEVLSQSKQVSPTNSKLCTPRLWKDEKQLSRKKSPFQQVLINLSQQNQKERRLDINLKGRSILYK